jgi:hypothetical protein
MKIRKRYVLPAMLLLAGCATTTTSSNYSTSIAAAPVAAPPQRVDAVSDAVGAKVDSMLVSNPSASNNLTR